MYANILVVDDIPANLRLLCSMLNDNGYEIRPVVNGATALSAAHAEPPDLVLLDINMPDMNGYEVCKALKTDDNLADIPVIFISALNETVDKVRAFEVGGVDYISKPFHIEEVIARIDTQLSLRRQRQELERLRERDRVYFEKLSQMKDDVVNHVSHDLKNPLSAVLMAVSLLEKCSEIPNADRQKYLAMIKRGAQRMQTLITDLLDLARIETGLALTKSPLDLQSVLECAYKSFISQAQEKNIMLHLNLMNTTIIVQADPTRLDQILHNLLSNALKYTPTGGRVEITTEIDQDHILIHVSDTGFGIPESALPHVFDKFFRVDTEKHRSVEGTGLGLAIVKSIVEQHDGNIEVQSELDIGTTFTIRLPCERQPCFS